MGTEFSCSDQIDTIVEIARQQNHLVGAAVGVMHLGKVVLAKGYGEADLKNEMKATEHTVFRIGSITKQFTAVGIMMLVERGVIQLDRDMRDYLPDYTLTTHKVTIKQLLNHTSGVKSMTDIKKFWAICHRDLSPREMVELFTAGPVEFEPGERFQYNNSGYYLLGLIIERITGLTYEEFLQVNIWQPLEMHNTHYLGSRGVVDNLAVGYDYVDGKWDTSPALGMKNPFAGGALGSSVQDLLKWQNALNTHQIITLESYAKMLESTVLNSGQMATYGYGFFLSDLEGHRKIEHGGDINGFRAQLSHYPDDGLTVSVLCNLGSAPRAQIESQIARAILGIPERVIVKVDLSQDELHLYIGTYAWCSMMAPTPFLVELREDGLCLGGRNLLHIGNHCFVFDDDVYHCVKFLVEKDKPIYLEIEREGQRVRANLIG